MPEENGRAGVGKSDEEIEGASGRDGSEYIERENDQKLNEESQT